MSYHLFRVLSMCPPVGAISGKYWQGKLEKSSFPGATDTAVLLLTVQDQSVKRQMTQVPSTEVGCHLFPLQTIDFYGVASRCGICTLEDHEVKSQRRHWLLATNSGTKYKTSLLGDGPSTLNVDVYSGDICPNTSSGPDIEYKFSTKTGKAVQRNHEIFYVGKDLVQLNFLDSVEALSYSTSMMWPSWMWATT